MFFSTMALVVVAALASAVHAEAVRKATPHFTPWCEVGHPVAGCLARTHDMKRHA
jgi:hypothetical protein